MKGMRVVRLWFYNPASESSSFFNKMVARLDPPFSHSELQFENEEASTIYHGDVARLKARAFDRQFYTCVCVPCTQAQYAQAYTFAQTAMTQALPFSTVAMGNSIFQLPLHTSGTFCSKLNADTLCSAGILSHIDTQTITPSKLHRLLTPGTSTEQCKQVQVTPLSGQGKSAALDWSINLHQSEQKLSL